MRARGFTLLEVLVALAIFATAAIALAAGYLNVLNAYDLVDRGNAHADDVRFARTQLLTEPDPQKAAQGGDFDSNGTQVSWHATIDPTDTANLFQVTFVCEFSAPGTGPTPAPVTETFMLLRPTWSQGADASTLLENARTRILKLQNKAP